MTQHLGIITAYGAVAILAWLGALLYPRLIPASGSLEIDRRWQRAGLFAAAALVSFGLEYLSRSGLLLKTYGPLFSAVNQLAISLPILAYIWFCGGRRVALIPEAGLVRSLAIGIGLAIIALATYFSTITQGTTTPETAQSLVSESNISLVLRTLVQSLALGAFLALVEHCWSARTALTLAAFAILLLHLPVLLENGFTTSFLAALTVHLALGLGLFSAILATRNIVWFWPVYAALTLVQINLG